MTISMVGHSEIIYTKDGGTAIDWPSGTAAGHTGIVVTATAGGGKPETVLPDDWKLLCVNSAKEAVWAKLALTESDIADRLDLNAVISGLVVLSGVKVFGAASPSKGVTLTDAAGAVLTFGRKSESSPALTPPTGRVFDTDAINPRYSRYKVKKKTHWRHRRYNAWLTIPGSAGYRSISSNADALMSVELIGSVSASNSAAAMTPTILTPADDSSVQQAGSYAFEWSLPTAYASPQWTVRQVQLRAVGSGAWGTVSGGTWYPADSSKTELASYTGSQTATKMTSALAAGSYEWRGRMQYAGSVWSAWSSSATFTVVAPPVLGAVSMTAALQPEVSWTVSSGSQAYVQVRVIDAAGTEVYDSGVVASTATLWTVPAQDWVNGGAYRAQVQITSVDGMTSTVVMAPSQTISWTPPPAPAGVMAVQGKPLSLTVVGLTAVHDQVRVTWPTSDSVTLTVLVDAAVGSVSVSLPLAPYGQTTYTVEASKLEDGVPLWSDARTVTVTNFDRGAYLASDDLTDWLQVWIAKPSEPVDSEGVAVSYPLGASFAVTMRTPSAGWSGTEEFFVAHQAAKVSLLAWMVANPTCWWRRPPERSDGVYADVPALHVSRSEPRSEARLVSVDDQVRSIPFAWVEVDD